MLGLLHDIQQDKAAYCSVLLSLSGPSVLVNTAPSQASRLPGRALMPSPDAEQVNKPTTWKANMFPGGQAIKCPVRISVPGSSRVGRVDPNFAAKPEEVRAYEEGAQDLSRRDERSVSRLSVSAMPLHACRST